MPKVIEFKSSNLTVMTVILRELDMAQLNDAMDALLGQSGESFSDELTILDLGQLKTIPQRVDWARLSQWLRSYGLQPVAVKNAPEILQDSARAAGFAIVGKQTARPTATVSPPPSAPVAAPKSEPAPEPAPAPPPETAPAPPASVSPAPTLAPPPSTPTTRVIDRLVRSGQQIYARGGDLVLLKGVSHGAEVMADGSIHCYGALRGRALAGAQGDTSARLYCSNFGPELVSIAGVYRTFEHGIPGQIAGKPACARLNAEGEKFTLSIEPLQLD